MQGWRAKKPGEGVAATVAGPTEALAPLSFDTPRKARTRPDTNRQVAFLCIVGAPWGLAVLSTGPTQQSWWFVAVVPIGLYCVYAFGVSRFYPAELRPPAPLHTDVTPGESRRDPDWLLLIRGLGCGLVYIWHTALAFKHDFAFDGSRWAWILESPGLLGMVMFFTMSGYLMGKGFYAAKYDLTRSGVVLYLRNRFLRIYPLMIVVALLVAVWAPTHLPAAPQRDARIALFGFNGLNEGCMGPFWSLSTEWQFYLLVPAVYAIALAMSRLVAPTPKVLLPVATLLILGVGIAIRFFMWIHFGGKDSWPVYSYLSLLSHIDEFLLGFLANWWIPRLASFARCAGAAWPLLLAGVYLAYSYISYQTLMLNSLFWWPFFAIVLPGVTALFLTPVLYGCELSNRKARLREVPQRRTAFVLFWMGALTYAFYLVHSPILGSVQNAMPNASYVVKWALATVFVIFTAWVLYTTVEKPVLNWRLRRRNLELH